MITPLPLKINDATMLRLVREAAQDSSRVFFEPHAKQRMRQRKITPKHVLACLRQGAIEEPAHLNIRGNWKCTLRHIYAGDEVRVVAVLEQDEAGNWIAVVTVF
ncbi:MAG: DUF4258 domain-containing protein [Giesbergeria sp.]|nr:DUF4258 domain-containing protein [Giesbergeria sp.]